MDAAGVLDERYDEVDDLVRARHVPVTAAGRHARAAHDRSRRRCQRCGVRLVGRLGGIHDGVAQFSGSLANTVAAGRPQAATDCCERLRRVGRASASTPTSTTAERLRADRVPLADPTLALDLRSGRDRHRSSGRPATARIYSWLDLPVFDRKGRIRHDGGDRRRRMPGLYLLGANLLRTRRSSYIDGAAPTPRRLAEHLTRDSKVCTGPSGFLHDLATAEGASWFLVQQRSRTR